MVFTNKEFSSFFNNHFIALKLVQNEGEGKYLRERFNVPGNPVIILVDGPGEEIDRIIGFSGDADIFVDKLKNYANGKGVLAALLKQYQGDSLSVDNNFALAEKYTNRHERQKAVIYYHNVLQLDPENKSNFGDVSKYHIALNEMWQTHKSDELVDFVSVSKNRDLLSDGYSNLVRFFSNNKDTIKLYETFEKAVAALPQNAGMMNQYAWTIYEDKNKIKYARGIELARKAVQIEPDNASIWDTLAWLLFEDGDKKGAVEAMQKAADLDPDYKENLKKIMDSV